jgi:thiol-disulfide isomerase/thioredoxin
MKNKILGGIFLLAVIGLMVWLIAVPAKPGKLDSLASCIKDSGAKFYGAFWCPHCQKQKGAFGRSARLLPYVECSTPDGKGQLQICKDAGVEGYPTWEFADGSRMNGNIALETLAEKTSCTIPE